MGRASPQVMRSKPIGRRAVLRGFTAQGVAVVIGLPALEIMLNEHGTAYAQGAPLLTRYGVWFFAGGMNQNWNPSQTGALNLGGSLAPLAPWKNHLTLISGLSGPSFGDYNTNRHIMGTAGGLSGYQPSNGAFTGPSIDHLASQQLQGGDTPSLQVGVSPALTAEKGTGWENISHRGANQPNPAEFDAARLLARLFTTAPAPLPTAVDEGPLRQSYLSAVRADVTDLNSKLGRRDQQLLDSYLSGISELEKTIAIKPVASPPVGTACANRPSLSGSGLEASSKNMAKVLALALACGKTRTFAFEFTKPNAFLKYPDLPDSHHNLGHSPQHARIVDSSAYTMQRFADLLAACNEIPEGAGTVLDNLAVLVQSDTSWDHSLTNMVAIIGGRAGGKLKGNLHVRSSGPVTRAALTAARAVGANLASVGAGDGLAKDSIGEVLS